MADPSMRAQGGTSLGSAKCVGFYREFIPRRLLRRLRACDHSRYPKPAGDEGACGVASLQQLPQHGSQLQQRPPAMAERMLDARAEFAERLMILRNEKERIVAEPAAAAIIGDDAAMAASL